MRLIRHFQRTTIIAAALFCLPGVAAVPHQAFAGPVLLGDTQDTDQSALPETPETPDRSPGMQLPTGGQGGTGPNAAANPLAPAQEQESPRQVQQEIRGQAFGAALTGLLPLKPEEIRKLLEHFDETRQAVETPIYPYPKPEVVAQTVSLDPGAQPPEVKLAVGHVTTISMLDVTGQPWPIQDISWAGNFDIVKPPAGSNVIRVTPMSEFTYGNISISLLNLKTPVTFSLRTHRDVVEYRFDARIPDNGPYAKAPLIDNSGNGITLKAGTDNVLNAFLDGIPPASAVRLSVSGADGRTTAYQYNGTTYVRTPLTLLSPGWSGSVSSADGMSVYAVANAPVLLLSEGGAMIQARLSDNEDNAHDQ